MKKIEVFTSETDNSMTIVIDELSIDLTAEEAALLDSLMARAYTRFEIRDAGEPDPPGQPLTKVRPLRAGQF